MKHRTESEEHEFSMLMAIMFNTYGLTHTLAVIIPDFLMTPPGRIDLNERWIAERYIILKEKGKGTC